MKNILLFALLFCGNLVLAQKRYSIEKGQVSFTSKTKLETINATSDKILGVIDPSNNQFAFIVKMQSFEGFNSDLQREHFNEKYVESDKFYQATFSGKFMEAIDFSKDGTYDVTANGSLTVHGKKQPRSIPGKITISKGDVFIQSGFIISLADHDIVVPKIVSDKIAPEINVTVEANLAIK